MPRSSVKFHPQSRTSYGAVVWIGLVALRIVNAVLVKTYFDPDEYWQSLEVAHLNVFHYGWKTWEWTLRLRSCLFLLPFIAYFKALKILELDSSDSLVIYGPRVLQSVLAATVDYLTYLVASKYVRQKGVAETALLISLLSWFNFSYYPRTLSNNLEVLLSLAALYYWPQDARYPLTAAIRPVALVGLAVLNRPSALTHWMVPALLLWSLTAGWLRKLALLGIASLVAGLCILVGFALDSWYYGAATFTWLNFVHFNVVERISSFYGTHPWHFYIVQAVPGIAGPLLPLVLLSLAIATGNGEILSMIAGSIFFNSLLPHKEIRFLAPLSPLLVILAAQGYRALGTIFKGRWRLLKRLLLLVILLANVVAGIYLARVHQSGVIAVVDYLRGEVDRGRVTGILYAMPCHSTPFYGYLHRNIPMRFITCEPPVGSVGDHAAYQDESDRFYMNPAAVLTKLDEGTSHLVLFEALLKREGVPVVLEKSGLRECWRTFNSHWNIDPRRRGDVLVYCRK